MCENYWIPNHIFFVFIYKALKCCLNVVLKKSQLPFCFKFGEVLSSSTTAVA